MSFEKRTRLQKLIADQDLLKAEIKAEAAHIKRMADFVSAPQLRVMRKYKQRLARRHMAVTKEIKDLMARQPAQHASH